MIQDEYIFDFDILGESVSLLINSNEQIIVEKLKSLLKFGITSTKYKDIFDIYYLINYKYVDKEKLLEYINLLIFQDENINHNNYEDLIKRFNSILNSKRFKLRIDNANSNWLEVPTEEVVNSILKYIESLRNVVAYTNPNREKVKILAIFIFIVNTFRFKICSTCFRIEEKNQIVYDFTFLNL